MKSFSDLGPVFKHVLKVALGLFSVLLVCWLVIYWNQLAILRHILNNLSEEIEGRLSIEDGGIAPFHKFPRIQIKLKAVKLYETQEAEEPLVEVEDIYIGLNFWSIWGKDYEITEIELGEGRLDLYEYEDKSFNVRRAIRPKKEKKDNPSHFNIHSIQLKKVGIQYQKYKSLLQLVFDIKQLSVEVEGLAEETDIKLQTNMALSLWRTDRLALLKDKAIRLTAQLHHRAEDDILKIISTTLKVEKGVFELKGSAKLRGIPWVDLEMKGKPNIASLMALIPVNMQSFWENYSYKGKAYFDAKVRGNLVKNNWPQIRVDWGAEKARIKHKKTGVELKDLSFAAYVDNSMNADLPYFSLEHCHLKLDTGYLDAYMHIYNRSMESLDANVRAAFNLGDLGRFLGIKARTPLNGAFNLLLSSKDDRLEIKDCRANLGRSDLKVDGHIQHIAGMFSLSEGVCKGSLGLKAKMLNLEEMTSVSIFQNAFNEKIKNFKADFHFHNAIVPTSASKRWWWELRTLNAEFVEYGHRIKALKGSLWQTEERFPDFQLKGKMDQTDIELSGNACHQKKGGSFIDQFDIELKAKRIGLKDLIGKNKHKDLPEDYAREALKDFRFKTSLFFKQQKRFWEEVHWHIDALEGHLTQHKVDMKFNADVQYQNACFYINQIKGQIGRSDLLIQGKYHPAFLVYEERPWSVLKLTSTKLDVDQLWTFRPKIYKKRADAKLGNFQPFKNNLPKVKLFLDIDEFNFRGQDIYDLNGRIHLGEGKKIHIQKLKFEIGEGEVDLRGVINGENPEAIYFEPMAKVKALKMEKLMAKSKKRTILSEHVVGALNADIEGRVQLHSNLKPIIEGTEISASLELIDGRLENYDPLLRFAKFFKDKNLRKIRFDTLRNELILKEDTLHIPNMEISSTLGFVRLWGHYELDKELNMYCQIPLKLVSKAIFQGLFKRQAKEIDENKEDEIEHKKDNPLKTYVYVNLKGRLGTYKLKLVRNPDKEKRSLLYKWRKYKKERLGR
jgi:hypothetical protein